MTRGLHRRFAEALDDPAGAQRATLARILGANRGAEYLSSLGVRGAMDPDEYRARVPLVTYDDLEPWIRRIAQGEQGILTVEPVIQFLKTSGSTGPAKLIPFTEALGRETGDARAWWVARMIQEDERNAVGKHLTVYSPQVEGYTEGGIPYGSNTGRIRNSQSGLVLANDPVPEEVFSIARFETKHLLIVTFALAARDLGTFTTANPSTVLLLMDLVRDRGLEIASWIAAGTIPDLPGLDPSTKAVVGARLGADPGRAEELRRHLGQRVRAPDVWPTLTTLNTWRCGGAAFYEPMLREIFDPIPIRDPGFSASEGFVAIPFTHRDPAGVLNVPGHFFEFLPPGAGGGETLLAHELEPGMEVEVVLTTSGGLYRYRLGDVAQVVGRHGSTPTLRFLRRAGRVLSITGEKVTEAHVERAAREAFEEGAVPAVDFVVGLELDRPVPGYVLLVEARGPFDASTLGARFDHALARANVEYEAKRASGRLSGIRVAALGPGAFDAFRAKLLAEGAPDAQVKLPHLAMDQSIVRWLERDFSVAQPRDGV